ncbi:hypothetical protein EVAR_74283_1 [Eumeta japonica]|uniref:Uncharacterized protein n=1 Tax=Eumeta variegata TaxID=151549 RepID=A0A4C1SDI6_EUMVA|nr:hypothetical protein EVAR_74283_1 [Eumeta japonica]
MVPIFSQKARLLVSNMLHKKVVFEFSSSLIYQRRVFTYTDIVLKDIASSRAHTTPTFSVVPERRAARRAAVCVLGLEARSIAATQI